MPELPEVETIRRGLVRRIVNKKITKVDVRKSKTVRSRAAQVRRVLIGARITRVKRRGKLLIFVLNNRRGYLLTHLKMTGQLIYHFGNKLIAGGHNWPPVSVATANSYTRVILHFADGSRLYFNDMRLFGYMQVVNQQQLKRVLQAYGLEPLSPSFTWPRFQQALSARTVSVKAALLDQSLIAGIGNIYADEILFRAKVRPTRRVSSLSEGERRSVYRAIQLILRRALRYGGTTFRNYRGADGRDGNFTLQLKVYGRGGKKCLRCGATLRKQKIAGRGTVYCLCCQH